MSVVHFQCPSCQAPLRLENRALFVGRTFDCPDCGESLLIEADGSTGVIAKRSRPSDRRASQGSDRPSAIPSVTRRGSSVASSKVSDRGVDLQAPSSVWVRLSGRPVLLGWIVAALFASVLLVVVNSGRDRRLPNENAPVVADIKPAEKKVDESKSSEESPPDSANPNSKLAIDSDPQPSKPSNAAANNDAPQLQDNSQPPPADVGNDLSPGNKLSAEPAPVENPAAIEPLPVAVPPPPEPAAESFVLTPEAIAAKLGQKIASFHQPKAVPFVKLLDTVEELAGVPIVWDLDRVTDEQLQKSVTLRLKETTVGEILDTLLKQVGLERRIVEGKIELTPSG
ncbi:MAG: hypothetical protein ACKV2Q_17145 [Planctomycetaceae bacterium]